MKIFLSGLLVTLIFLGILFFRPSFFIYLENKLYDTLHQSVQRGGPSSVLIVDIDEDSLARYGQWPWPRNMLSRLFGRIAQAGPGAVGLDILFAEPDRTSLAYVQKALVKELGITLNLSKIPLKYRDNDLALAAALKEGPFAIGYKFRFADSGAHNFGAAPMNISVVRSKGAKNTVLDLYQAKGAIEPLPDFYQAGGGAGFINIHPDLDGVIRRVPLLIQYDGQIYPSLALASVMTKLGTTAPPMLRVSEAGVDALYLNGVRIPLDAKGNLLIRFKGEKNAFEYISAADILSGRIKPEKLAGKIVFVGTSATGLKDFFTTPGDTFFPGVEVHATVADNILNHSFLERPDWAKGLEILVTVAAGLLVSLILAGSSPVLCLIFPAVVAGGLWVSSVIILKSSGIYFSPLYPIVNVMACFTFLNLLRFNLADKQARLKTLEIQRMEGELSVAREIQMGVVPKVFPPFPERDEFDLSAVLIPAREVGGDLYDFFFLDENRLCFTIGDVSGKGVPASLFMVITRTLIKNLAGFCSSVSELMEQVNSLLDADNPQALFVTLFIGILDVNTGEMEFANGGHNPPVVFSKEKGIYFNKESSGPIVGAFPDLPYKNLSLTLGPGDGILLYTDGVNEAMDSHDNQFTDQRLLELCQSMGAAPAQVIIDTILKAVRDHAGAAPQSDDIAMVMLRFNH